MQGGSGGPNCTSIPEGPDPSTESANTVTDDLTTYLDDAYQDPWVAGSWWYTDRDDPNIGAFGLLNDDNSPRPAFTAMAQWVAAHGGDPAPRTSQSPTPPAPSAAPPTSSATPPTSSATPPASSGAPPTSSATPPATSTTTSTPTTSTTGTAATAAVPQPPAKSPAVTLSNPPSTEQTAPLAGGAYLLKLNEGGGSDPVSISSDGAPDLKIASSSLSLTSGVEGCLELLQGCSWGGCTNNNGAPFPIQVSSIQPGQLTSSAACQTSGVAGQWDNAYDIWFNSDQNAGHTDNAAGDHLEMMVWLDQAGVTPIPPMVASSVKIGSNTFDVWHGGDNTVSYVLTQPSGSISFDLHDLIADAERRGYLQSSWWLLDVEMGVRGPQRRRRAWLLGLLGQRCVINARVARSANIGLNTGR